MKRRNFLGLSAVGVLAASPLARAATDDAKVFLNYTQAQLDDAYTQTKWAPNAKEVIARYTTDSEKVRLQTPPRTFKYGEGASESLDVYAPAGARDLPILVFIHGGAWKALSKDDSAAPAPTLTDNGAIFIALNFDNLPAVTLPAMADQCRRAIAWIAANAATFGGNAKRMYVGGHSSGGHLIAVMLTTDWQKLGLPSDVLKGGVVMSGMGDLTPVMMSVRSNYVKLTEAEKNGLSPVQHMQNVNCPVIVAWGENESPEFKRQSLQLAAALREKGRLAGTYFLRGRNHFEVVEALNTASSPMSQGVLALMNVGI